MTAPRPTRLTGPTAPTGLERRYGSRHLTIGLLLALGLLVSLLLAFIVSPFASSSPDGLEKVAADKAIDRDERDHALADGPLADYAVQGVDDERLSTGLAGVVGVAVTFAIGGCLFLVLRRTGGRRNGSAPDLAVVSSSPPMPARPARPATEGGP